MVSLERRHYNALDDNIFYGILACISGEITLESQVPLAGKSDLPKHVKSMASVTLINQIDFGAPATFITYKRPLLTNGTSLQSNFCTGMFAQCTNGAPKSSGLMGIKFIINFTCFNKCECPNNVNNVISLEIKFCIP